MYALDTIRAAEALQIVIVFCDIMRVAEILHAHYDGSFLMTGKDDTSTRDETLTAFQRKHDGAASHVHPRGEFPSTFRLDVSWCNFTFRAVLANRRLSDVDGELGICRACPRTCTIL